MSVTFLLIDHSLSRLFIQRFSSSSSFIPSSHCFTALIPPFSSFFRWYPQLSFSLFSFLLFCSVCLSYSHLLPLRYLVFPSLSYSSFNLSFLLVRLSLSFYFLPFRFLPSFSLTSLFASLFLFISLLFVFSLHSFFPPCSPLSFFFYPFLSFSSFILSYLLIHSSLSFYFLPFRYLPSFSLTSLFASLFRFISLLFVFSLRSFAPPCSPLFFFLFPTFLCPSFVLS